MYIYVSKDCVTMWSFLDIVAMSQVASDEGGSSSGTQQQVIHNLWQSWVEKSEFKAIVIFTVFD